MKKSIGLILIFMVLAVSSVMGQEEERQLCKEKIHTYTKKQNVGLTLTGIGGGSLLAGSLLLATLPKSYWDQNYAYINPNHEKYDQQAIQGMVFISLGMGLLAGGLTMSHLAKRKANSYTKQLNSLSIGLINVPRGQGLSLTYRF